MSFNDILKNLSAEQIIITANQRMSLELTRAYDKTNNNITFPSLNSKALNIFLAEVLLEQSLCDLNTPILLKQFEEYYYFSQILLEKFDLTNFDLNTTARQALSAYKFCLSYNLPFSEEKFASIYSSKLFFKWISAYREFLAANNYLSSEEVINYIVNNFQAFSFTNKYIFYGFDEITPQLNLLLAKFKKNNIDYQIINNQNTPKSMGKIEIKDFDKEIETAILFAKEQAKYDKTTAIVVKDLPAVRQKIDFLAKELLAIDVATAKHDLSYNISAGLKLANYPIIDILIKVLNLNLETSDKDIWLKLFSSNYIITDNVIELEKIKNIVANCNYYQLSLAKILNLISEDKELTAIYNLLGKYIEFYQKKLAKAKLNHWCKYVYDLLNLFNWPGEKRLTSEEHQLMAKFYDILTLLDSRANNFPKISYFEFKHILFTYFSDLSFQGQANSNAKIHFLGVLEAANLEFDNIWFLSVDANSYPFKAKPNPYIPIDLQLKYNLPHSSAKRELEYSINLLNSLKNSTKENFICSVAINQDNQIATFSNLIADYPMLGYDKLILASGKNQANKLYNLTSFIDEKAKPFLTNQVKGGAKLFNLQAKCPFRAFAEIRLALTTKTMRDIAPSKMDRGIAIHKVLEKLMQYAKDSSCLANITDKNIINIIDNTFFELDYEKYYNSNILNLEKQCIKKLIIKFIEFEQNREYFTVKATEKPLSFTINDLAINLRLDRVDSIGPNSHIIIDYKTSSQNLANCYGDDILDFQLPLYAIGFDGGLDYIAYYEILPDAVNFKAINLQDNKDLYAKWDTAVKVLAEDFKTGEASVAPIDISACRGCHLHSVCRIKERATVG